MKKYIKLELKRIPIRTYVIASFIIAITMLGFLYLFAYAPMLEPNDKDMEIFMGYNNLIPLFCGLNMYVFCVLSAVMYSKFIIEEYAGKRSYLLFSYPVSRCKIVVSKLSVVSGFTIISMIISDIAIFLIFGITEKFIHLTSEEFTVSSFLQAVTTTLVMAFIAASIGVVAVGIGFIKKSIPTTIISAVLIASLMANIVVSTTANRLVMYAFAMVIIFIGTIMAMLLIKKVISMEVE